MRRVVKLAAKGAVVALIVAVAAAGAQYRRARQIREAVYEAFAPVKITNCQLEWFGDWRQGGYVMCGKLASAATAAYSYGSTLQNAWECEVATRLKIPINQYSCSTTSAPACAGDLVRVHAECLGPERATVGGRPVDTMASHIEKNGDVGKRIVVTLDAGGAEWRSLAGAPEHVLNAIDQMAVVFHDVENPSFMDTARRLDEFFYVAHITPTVSACRPGYDPFRGPAFTALFVNKRIAVADPWVNARGPSPLATFGSSHCPSPAESEAERIVQWVGRQWLDWQSRP